MLTRHYPALSSPPFARFLLAHLVSGLGSSMNVIALSLLLYQLTGNVAALVGMWTARVVSRLLLQPVFGVLVDRSDKKKLLFNVHLLNALTAAAFVLVDRDHLWLAFALTFLLQCLDGLAGPALGAAFPSLVPREQLVSANALSSLVGKVSGSLGPALAGVIFGLWGAGPLFVFNALSFVVIALTVTSLPLGGKPVAPRQVTFWGDFAAGWRVALTHRLVLTVLLLSLVSNLAWRALEIALVPWATELPSLGTSGYGLLFTALTLGGVAGALIVPRLHLERAAFRKLLVAFGLSGLPLLAMTAWPVPAVAFVAMFACGILLDVVAITTASTLQASVEPGFLGRVFAAVNVSAALGVLPVLAGLTGFTAAFGHGAVIANAGLVTTLAALTLALLSRRGRPVPPRIREAL